jgi:hypothetical protein
MISCIFSTSISTFPCAQENSTLTDMQETKAAAKPKTNKKKEPVAAA